MKKFATVLVASCLLFVAGCESHVSSEPAVLPLNAKNQVQMGNGWITFEMDYPDRTDTYLYHRSTSGSGHRGYEAITKIKEVRKN